MSETPDSRGGDPTDLWFDPWTFETSVAGVAHAYDTVAVTISELVGSTPGGVDVFGDDAVRSACSAFHSAWLQETGVTTSALAAVAELLPRVSNSFGSADLQSADAINALVPKLVSDAGDPPVDLEGGG
ncbi:hypothetical protein ACFROC_19150 [Nocardia tengchongensis]|uniref:hypothetical protein n=1 Tax=Nocardia tengchongensis TaxID=2055889 RepID=UPI00369227B6